MGPNLTHPWCRVHVSLTTLFVLVVLGDSWKGPKPWAGLTCPPSHSLACVASDRSFTTLSLDSHLKWDENDAETCVTGWSGGAFWGGHLEGENQPGALEGPGCLCRRVGRARREGSLPSQRLPGPQDKRFTSGKYQDVYVELNHIKTRSEREIEQLKEHLRLAMAALQEKEAVRNSLAE